MQTLKSCNDLCHMAVRWVRLRGKKSSRHRRRKSTGGRNIKREEKERQKFI